MINILCEQALVYTFGAEQSCVEAEMVQEVAGDLESTTGLRAQTFDTVAAENRVREVSTAPVTEAATSVVSADSELRALVTRQSIVLLIATGLLLLASFYVELPAFTEAGKRILQVVLGAAWLVLPFYLKLIPLPSFTRRTKSRSYADEYLRPYEAEPSSSE